MFADGSLTVTPFSEQGPVEDSPLRSGRFSAGYIVLKSTDIRALAVLEVRRAGLTLLQIGKQFGFTKQRARQLELFGLKVERDLVLHQGRPASELSPRLRNALIYQAGCEPTPEAVVAHFTSIYELRRIPNIGEKSISELNEWLVRHGERPIP